MIPLSLDHMVVTVSDMDRACEFYARVLGAEIVTFGAGRKALRIGRQKLNLHDAATAGAPVARSGAVAALRAVYIRDPDGSLIEIANPLAG